MNNKGLFQNDKGYVMSYTEMYFDIHNTVYSFFRELGMNYFSLYDEATVMTDGIIKQIELFDEYSYHGRKWKRFV